VEGHEKYPVTSSNRLERCLVVSLSSVRRTLKKAYQEAAGRGGWRKVGAQFGISPAMALRIANQKYEPKDPKIRVRLGLPARVEVSACPVCGEVHVKKNCPKRVIRHRDLFAEDPEELRRALEERKEFTPSRLPHPAKGAG